MGEKLSSLNELLNQYPDDAIIVEAVRTMGGSPVDMDMTVLIYLVVFVGVWIGLKVLLFDPYMKVKDLRAQSTTGTRDEAAALQIQAQESVTKYEVQLADAKKKAAAVRNTLKEEAAVKQSTLVDDARSEAQAKLGEHRKVLQGQVESARTEMRQEAEVLSKLIVSQLVPSA